MFILPQHYTASQPRRPRLIDITCAKSENKMLYKETTTEESWCA